MLGICKVGYLAANIDEPESELLLAAEYGHEDIREYTLWPTDPKKKPRDVIAVHGRRRRIQSRLYNRIFRTRLSPSPFSHGGVPKRHALSNASEHFGNDFALSMDVADFYPSISNSRVNRLFLERLKCSSAVSRILTRICTHDFHLALGLITSPVLADQIMWPIDRRIGQMCAQAKLCYTRFVDDITISGNYDLEAAGIPSLIQEILADHGLKVKKNKTQFGRISKGFEITGIRLNRGHPDVGRKFIREVERLLDDHHSLASDGQFDGPLMTSSQLAGKVHAICWINPFRRAGLWRRLRSIRWDAVLWHAVQRSLVRFEPKLAPRGVPRPDLAVEFVNSAGRNSYEQFRNSAAYNPNDPPF